MERTWTEVGAAVVGRRLEDGARLTKRKVVTAIDGFEWQEIPEGGSLTLAAMPGLGIKTAVAELGIPNVSHVAVSSELAPYGLYGIEGHYRNGRARVYVVDEGAMLTPIASDFWPDGTSDDAVNPA